MENRQQKKEVGVDARCDADKKILSFDQASMVVRVEKPKLRDSLFSSVTVIQRYPVQTQSLPDYPQTCS